MFIRSLLPKTEAKIANTKLLAIILPFIMNLSLSFHIDKFVCRCGLKTTNLPSLPSKSLINMPISSNLKTFSRNSSPLHEPILRCEEKWRNWEQLWYVAFSTLIISLTMATLTLLGTCVVRIQSVLGIFECGKKLSNLSAETIVNVVLNAHLRVKCAKFFLMDKQFCFSWRCDQWIYIFEYTQKTIQDVIGDISCSGRYFIRPKCVYVQI